MLNSSEDILEEIRDYDEKILQYEMLGAIEPITFLDALLSWKEKWPQKTAVIFDEEKITYEQLEEKTRQLANGLYARGIRKGDHAMMHMGNGIHFVVVLFALFRMGVKPVMMLNTHRENELKAIMERIEPKVYFTSNFVLGTDFTEIAKSVIEQWKQPILAIYEEPEDGFVSLDEVYQQKDEPVEPPYYKETALYLLSGGTTGVPKVIPKSHAAYLCNTKYSAKRCGINENTVYMAVLSIAHDYPLCSPGILGTMVNGGTVVLAQSPDPEEAFSLIRKYKVTAMSLVPAIIQIWMEFYEFEEQDIDSIQQIMIGAAKLEEGLGRAMIDAFHCKLIQGYGLGEGITCFTSPEDNIEVSLFTHGKPVSKYDEVRIVDEEGNEVPTGEYGELLQKGPYTFTGYYHAPELNRNLFTPDGFFKTGDRAMKREDGNIVIAGRVVEQINRAGENVIPSEIESYLRNIEGISDAAVVGIADEELGERTCAFVITEDPDMRDTTIKEKLKEQKIAVYKIPDQIIKVDKFPYTNIGKVNKKELVRQVIS
ncbi:MAG: AMP-binding protein [Lachnospiraceae bacterium]|nr:AMP-binding protein [Lachnospiraceae bacterium]